MDVAAELGRGSRGAVARAITMIEDDPAGSRRLLREIYGKAGNAGIVGITGPAGAGKSSLVNRTAVALKGMRAKPAILAVDPTSHITGGAILGDRVRMAESTDSGIYMRSIASRGSRGAVSASLRDSIRVLEYAGFDPILVESVGAGQTEVDIASIADVTVVVFNPNTGDSIQAIKAGLTEIGDIYLVNKSDLAGSARLYDAVRDFIGGDGGPPVLKTSAKRGSGIAEFARLLRSMLRERKKAGPGAAEGRLVAELRDIILNNISEKVDDELRDGRTAKRYIGKLRSKEIDPYEAGARIARSLLR